MSEFIRFTEWYPRKACNAVFTVEALQGGVRVSVETKDRSELDAGAVSTASEIDARMPGVHAAPALDLKDLVRFRIVQDGSDREWRHFCLLPPTWDKVDAPESEPPGAAVPQQ